MDLTSVGYAAMLNEGSHHPTIKNFMHCPPKDASIFAAEGLAIAQALKWILKCKDG